VDKAEYVAKNFPDIVPKVKPAGNQILIQLKTVTKKSSGGIVLVEETRDFNQGNTQVAKLVKVGQIAYQDRNTGETWKEGAWANVGDLVLAPRFGGFRFELPIPGSDDTAVFALINDFDVKMVIEGDFEAFDRIL